MVSFIPDAVMSLEPNPFTSFRPSHLMTFFDAEINLLLQVNMGESELNASFDQNKTIVKWMGTCQGRSNPCPSCRSHDAVDRGKLGLLFFSIFNETVVQPSFELKSY